MKKKAKRALSLLLSVAMCIGLLPTTVLAADVTDTATLSLDVYLKDTDMAAGQYYILVAQGTDDKYYAMNNTKIYDGTNYLGGTEVTINNDMIVPDDQSIVWRYTNNCLKNQGITDNILRCSNGIYLADFTDKDTSWTYANKKLYNQTTDSPISTHYIKLIDNTKFDGKQANENNYTTEASDITLYKMAPLQITVKGINKDETGAAQSLVQPITSIVPTGYTLKYSMDDGTTWDPEAPTAKDPGEYTVTVGLFKGEEMVGTEQKFKATINDVSAAVGTAPTAKTPTYSGSNQDLVNAGTVSSGATMMYAVTTENEKPADTTGFSSSAEASAADTYYVWYYAKGNGDWLEDSAIAEDPVEVTIGKANATVTVSDLTIAQGAAAAWPTATSTTGIQSGDSAVVEIWNGSTQITKAENLSGLAAGKYTIKGTVTNAANYTITSEAKTLTVLAPVEKSAITAEGGLTGIQLTGGKAGSTTYSDSNKLPVDGGSNPTFSIVPVSDPNAMQISPADKATIEAKMAAKAAEAGRTAYLVELNLYVNNAGALTYVDGAKLSKPITVTVPFSGAKLGKDYDIYHWNGTDLETVKTGITCTQDGYLTFTTDSFSPFVIVGIDKFYSVTFSTGANYTFIYPASGDVYRAQEGQNYSFKLSVDKNYTDPVVYDGTNVFDLTARDDAVATVSVTTNATATIYDITLKAVSSAHAFTVQSLTPVGVPTYTVTYHDDGSTSGVAPTDANTYTTTFTVKDAGTLVKTGYTFEGWANATGATTANYLPGSSYSIAANLNLYPVWKEVSATSTYAVTFNEGTAPTGAAAGIVGTAPTMANRAEGDVFALPANPFSIQKNADGTSFVMTGWKSSVDSKTYAPGSEYTMPAQAVTFTAQWQAIAPNQAYVVYDANGGINPPVDSHVYAIGADVTLRSDAGMTREGYAFASWNTKADGSGTDITQITGITAGTHTVYAKWTPVTTYTVTYAAGGATGTVPVDSARYAAGDLVVLKDPTMLIAPASATPGKHNEFAGWKIGSTTYAAGSSIVMPAANTTITAQWTEVDNDQYVVFIDLDGGTGTYTNTAYAAGASATAPATEPTRDGYTFEGWSYNGSATIYDAGDTFTMPAANVTLVATWEAQTAKVTYTATGADGGSAPTDSTAYIKGTTFVVLEGTLTKTNYAFAGWTDGTNTYLPGSSYIINADLTLNPIFEAETLYTLSSNNNDGSSTDVEVGKAVKGGVVVAPAAPTRTGYAFLGWNTQANGLGTTYMPGSNVALYSDITLYAQWESTKTYTVTFDNGTATDADEAIQGAVPTMTAQKEGAVIVLPANPFTIQNNADGTSFVMTGWKCSANDTVYAPGSEYTMTAANTTFTAQWAAIAPNQAYVVYNANGGINPPVDYTVYTENDTPAVKGPDAMSRDGYVFKGWATTSTGTVAYAAGATLAALPAGTTELFAVWQAVPTYYVIYDANYGTGGSGNGAVPTDDNKYADGEIFEVKGCGTMTKTATATSYFVFDGWNTKADGTGTKIVPGSSIEVTAALRGADGYDSKVTLYAIWKEVAFETYPVIYDLAGASAGSATTWDTHSYVKDAKVSTAAAPTRTGYTFRGWAYGSIDSGITYAEDVTDAFPMPAETVYLIAIWDEQFTVTYNANGGTGAAIVDNNNGNHYYAGDEATVQANGFTKTDYSFAGWNTQPNGTGTTYMPGDKLPITGNVTLYAQWSTDYQIIFDDNLDDPLDDYVYMTTTQADPNPSDSSFQHAVLNVNTTATLNGKVPTFKRVDYDFVNWYKDAECTKLFDETTTLEANDIASLDADGDKVVTLYAKWAPKYDNPADVVINTSAMDNGMYGIYYSDYIEATTDPTVYPNPVNVYRNFYLAAPNGAISGSNVSKLPEGLVLNNRTGEIYGVPTKAGTYTFYVRMANDGKVNFISPVKEITITIDKLPVTIDHKDGNTYQYDKTYGDLEAKAKNLDTPKAREGLTLKSSNLTFNLKSKDLAESAATELVADSTKATLTVSNANQTATFAFNYADADTARGHRPTFDPAVAATLMNASDLVNTATMASKNFTDTVTAPMARVTGEDADTYKLYLTNDDTLTIVRGGDVKPNYAVTVPDVFSTQDKAGAAAKYLFTINPAELEIDIPTGADYKKIYGENDGLFASMLEFSNITNAAETTTPVGNTADKIVTISFKNGIVDKMNVGYTRVAGEDADTYKIYLLPADVTGVSINSVTTDAAAVAAKLAQNYRITIPDAFQTPEKTTSTASQYLFTINTHAVTFTPDAATITYGDLKVAENVPVEGTLATGDAATYGEAENLAIGVDDAKTVKVNNVYDHRSQARYLKAGTYTQATSPAAFVFTMTNGANPMGTADADTLDNYGISYSIAVAQKGLTVAGQTVNVTKGTIPTAANIEALAKLNGVLAGDAVTLTVTGYGADVDGNGTTENYTTAAALVAAFTTFSKTLDADMAVKVNYSGITGVDAGNYSLTAGNVDATLKAYTAPTGGGGGGGGGVSTYTITVDSAENGKMTSSNKSAAKGATVTLTVEPDSGYTLETLTVTDAKGNEVSVTEKDGKYTFTMPASNVIVKATFVEEKPVVNPFIDVKESDYFYNAVMWAVKTGVTKGTSATTFSPNAPCTRSQIVTFLWRASGSPAPKISENPFTDLKADAYYYDAVLWAVEQGITSGTGGGKFSPEANCTRAQMATFLCRMAGGKAASSTIAFTDVSADAYYAESVQWAVENGITLGTGDGTTFSPNDICTRAQMVTFLYRFFVK